MPTYDYQCESCGRTFEYFQSMNDPRLETCQFPDCDGKVKRLLGTGAGIIFKGSGFYETDYRSESYKKGAESAKSDSSKGTGDSKSSSSSKEASKKGSDSGTKSSPSSSSGNSSSSKSTS